MGAQGIQNVDLTDRKFKLPGYTGHIHGKAECFGKTPVLEQVEAHQPPPQSFLAARNEAPAPSSSAAPPPPAPAACGGGAPNLWPCQQTQAAQRSAKPEASQQLVLGDNRVKVFVTSYGERYAAPLPGGNRIRSPLRNKTLERVSDLSGIYRSAYSRVGEKRLRDIHHHMRERLTGKLGNCNDNAFRLRKLFKMYDMENTGYVGIEDFRVMTESFGMQLDDDSLFALFFKYDPEATGQLQYHKVMRELLDADSYALYAGVTRTGPQRGLEQQPVSH